MVLKIFCLLRDPLYELGVEKAGVKQLFLPSQPRPYNESPGVHQCGQGGRKGP